MKTPKDIVDSGSSPVKRRSAGSILNLREDPQPANLSPKAPLHLPSDTCSCGKKMTEHPKCESCGIYVCAGDYFYPIEKFRKHNLCQTCIKNWKSHDRVYEREATSAEFKTGKKGAKASDEKDEEAKDT